MQAFFERGDLRHQRRPLGQPPAHRPARQVAQVFEMFAKGRHSLHRSSAGRDVRPPAAASRAIRPRNAGISGTFRTSTIVCYTRTAFRRSPRIPPNSTPDNRHNVARGNHEHFLSHSQSDQLSLTNFKCSATSGAGSWHWASRWSCSARLRSAMRSSRPKPRPCCSASCCLAGGIAEIVSAFWAGKWSGDAGALADRRALHGGRPDDHRHARGKAPCS